MKINERINITKRFKKYKINKKIYIIFYSSQIQKNKKNRKIKIKNNRNI